MESTLATIAKQQLHIFDGETQIGEANIDPITGEWSTDVPLPELRAHQLTARTAQLRSVPWEVTVLAAQDSENFEADFPGYSPIYGQGSFERQYFTVSAYAVGDNAASALIGAIQSAGGGPREGKYLYAYASWNDNPNAGRFNTVMTLSFKKPYSEVSIWVHFYTNMSDDATATVQAFSAGGPRQSYVIGRRVKQRLDFSGTGEDRLIRLMFNVNYLDFKRPVTAYLTIDDILMRP